jgi:hypothetical protein
MPQVIRVRDVVRGDTHELGPQERALRVPYDMFHPAGAVQLHDAEVEWVEGETVRHARFTEAVLGGFRPGERVLVCFTPSERDGKWWLCDVQAVDGVAAD